MINVFYICKKKIVLSLLIDICRSNPSIMTFFLARTCFDILKTALLMTHFNIIFSFHMFIMNQCLIIICADSTAWCLFPIWLYLSSRPAGASRCTRIGNYRIVEVLYLLIEVTSFQPVVTSFLLEMFRVNMWQILDSCSPEPCVCRGTSLWGILQATLIFCQSYEG